MRSNLENRRQPSANEPLGSLLLRWGFVSSWGREPYAEILSNPGAIGSCV